MRKFRHYGTDGLQRGGLRNRGKRPRPRAVRFSGDAGSSFTGQELSIVPHRPPVPPLADADFFTGLGQPHQIVSFTALLLRYCHGREQEYFVPHARIFASGIRSGRPTIGLADSSKTTTN